jgi:hypothetical protein
MAAVAEGVNPEILSVFRPLGLGSGLAGLPGETAQEALMTALVSRVFDVALVVAILTAFT